MSVCNCTGKCTIFPYTCTGITSTPITIPVDMNYLSLTNRIKALHEHKIRQIDENRKVSRRIDDNEKGLQNHHDMLLKLEERINTLQEKITLNPKESMELRCVLKRLDTIEEKQKFLETNWQKRMLNIMKNILSK
jgi:predicted RNase H-like nuclease (RuvC/YqgF family)